MYLVRVYQIGLLAVKTNSIRMTKRRRINFLTMLALFSSFVLLAPSLLSLLPSLLQGATAQMPPEGCNKCIVIEYEDGHTAVLSGVEFCKHDNTTGAVQLVSLEIYKQFGVRWL
jgi:hypothetical protein